MSDLRADAKKAVKAMNAARNSPEGTCPASRHVALIAETLAKGKPYHMLTEEPEHCAISLASTVQSLWDARAAIAALRAKMKEGE
jgi:hypothetical protein